MRSQYCLAHRQNLLLASGNYEWKHAWRWSLATQIPRNWTSLKHEYVPYCSSVAFVHSLPKRCRSFARTRARQSWGNFGEGQEKSKNFSKTSLLSHKAASQFPRGQCCPYHPLLSGANFEIEVRSYVRGATKIGRGTSVKSRGIFEVSNRFPTWKPLKIIHTYYIIYNLLRTSRTNQFHQSFFKIKNLNINFRRFLRWKS